MQGKFTTFQMIVIISLMFILGYCLYRVVKDTTNVVAEKNERLEIVDGPLIVNFDKLYIVKDRDTKREFLYVNGASAALCPIDDAVVEP